MAIDEGRNTGVAVGREKVSVLLPMIKLSLLPSEIGFPETGTPPPGAKTLLITPTPEPEGRAMIG